MISISYLFEVENIELVNPELKEYIESKIIPMYDKHDSGHRQDHVKLVMNTALDLAVKRKVDVNMTFAAAAYHDVGIPKGREEHHINSAKFVLADKNLKKWFTEEQIKDIADACEDHRASNPNTPRTLLGKIIQDSDKTPSLKLMIKRSYLYGKDNYLDMDREQLIQRSFDHLSNKFGEKGYAKYYLPETKKSIQKEQQKIYKKLKNFNTFKKEVDKVILPNGDVKEGV